MDEADRSFAAFRDSSLDRWHRKTMLSAGNAAMRSNLRALNQSVSQQVAALMANPAKLLQRTQLVRWGPSPLNAALNLQEPNSRKNLTFFTLVLTPSLGTDRS